MFLQTIDENERHQVLLDDRNGLFLLFADSRDIGTVKPFTPHWVKQIGDHRTLGMVCRWFNLRRQQWQAWGKLAAVVGHAAFARYIDTLMASEPPEEVVGTILHFAEDRCEIVLGEQVDGARGFRQVMLYRHRFESAEARARFDAWVERGRNIDRLEEFVSIGFTRGSASVAEALDGIAGQQVDGPRQHGRKAARSSRRRARN